jgi:hypothetical protein
VKLRSFLLVLATVALVLLGIAGGSLSWILGQSPLSLLKGGVQKEPTAAIFVPKQAPVMVSLLVNPDRLESFAQLIAYPKNRRRSRREIEQVEKSLLANTGLDYQKEIRPWVGEEVTLAVTSLDRDRDPSNGVQPGYLLAVATKDPELAKEFLQVSYSQQAISGTFDLVFEQYKGIDLVYKRSLQPSLKTSFIASAVVGDFVLFANDPKVLRDGINNVQVADLNLKNATSYQEALQTIPDPRIGIVYANLPAVSAWIANAPVPETPEVRQMLAIALSLKSQGLVAQTALIGVSGEENQAPALAAPVGALAYIPSDSVLTAAGTNLKQFWTQIETGIAPDSPLQQLLKQSISLVEEPLGLSLPEDIFSWVQGEYSLALVPHPDGKEPDWIFIAEKTPDAGVEDGIAHLDGLAKEQGYSVGNLPLLDKTITAWTKLTTTSGKKKAASLASLEAQVKGVHATIDKYEIFATSVEAMSKALQGIDTSLETSQKFQQAIAALPTENDGYFYIDWNQSEPILETRLPLVRVIELAGKPLFKNLRSLTISSQGSQNTVRRATIFFNLGVR